MQDKAIGSIVEQDQAIDEAIMGMLLSDHPGLWSVAEIERELGDAVDAQDGLSRLVGAGLAYRVAEDFVVPSRAATSAAEVFDR